MREISKIENDGSPLKCVATSSVEDDSEWLLEDAFSIDVPRLLLPLPSFLSS
jgi:hypothetical protein